MSDIQFIRRELREAFPDEKITVTKRGKRGFNLRFNENKLDPKRVKRVIDKWYSAACGTTVRWGKATKAKG